LDIDVDFLLTRFMWDDLDPGRVPWIFPEDLHARLASKLGEIDVLTIAYSVEGGFTPLKFKYFGDELRCLFGGEALVTTRYKRAALMCEQQGKYADAAAAYEQTLQADDRDASGYYNLALLHMNGLFDRDGKAVYYYNEAVRRDRTYSTRYNNYGIIYLQRNKPKKAEAEFQKILRLDADNTAALNGLGYVSLTQRRYDKAGAFFDRCLAIDAKYPEARIGKAIVCVKKGLLAEAETLFFGLTQDHPEEAEAYWWLGRIAQKRRDVSLAINCYKDAVMRGGEGPVVHLILARLYIQKRFYFRAFEELKRSFDALRALS
jgi:tetratricopeptide (TPR) repeat protein